MKYKKLLFSSAALTGAIVGVSMSTNAKADSVNNTNVSGNNQLTTSEPAPINNAQTNTPAKMPAQTGLAQASSQEKVTPSVTPTKTVVSTQNAQATAKATNANQAQGRLSAQQEANVKRDEQLQAQQANNQQPQGQPVTEASITVPTKSYGVDVSGYQGTNLGTDASHGAKYAIVKVSEGTSIGQGNAAAQIKSAEANGMQVDAYHFAHFGGSTSQADAEATHAIANAEYYGLPKGSYLACDYETNASGSVSANTAAIIEFMNRIKNAGYIPLLYSGAYYMKSHINLNQIVADFGNCLWVASYPTSGATYSANFNYFPSMNGVAIWQFTDDWDGLGVDGDINVLPLTTGQGSSSSSDNYKQNYQDGDAVTINNSAQKWTNGSTINHSVTNGKVYIVTGVASGDGGAVKLEDAKTGTDMSAGGKAWMNDWDVTPYTGESLDGTGHWGYWKDGSRVKNSYMWLSGENKEVYYDQNGDMVYGQKNINGHWQYFEPTTGAQVKNSFVDGINGGSVFYDGNGNMVYGLQNVWNAWRYFDPNTGVEAKNKFETVNGQTYYFGSDGSRQYGVQTINSQMHYFDPQSGAEAINTDKTINNKEYHFDQNGVGTLVQQPATTPSTSGGSTPSQSSSSNNNQPSTTTPSQSGSSNNNNNNAQPSAGNTTNNQPTTGTGDNQPNSGGTASNGKPAMSESGSFLPSLSFEGNHFITRIDFNGVTGDEITVSVKYIDANTGKVIATGTATGKSTGVNGDIVVSSTDFDPSSLIAGHSIYGVETITTTGKGASDYTHNGKGDALDTYVVPDGSSHGDSQPNSGNTDSSSNSNTNSAPTTGGNSGSGSTTNDNKPAGNSNPSVNITPSTSTGSQPNVGSDSGSTSSQPTNGNISSSSTNSSNASDSNQSTNGNSNSSSTSSSVNSSSRPTTTGTISGETNQPSSNGANSSSSTVSGKTASSTNNINSTEPATSSNKQANSSTSVDKEINNNGSKVNISQPNNSVSSQLNNAITLGAVSQGASTNSSSSSIEQRGSANNSGSNNNGLPNTGNSELAELALAMSADGMMLAAAYEAKKRWIVPINKDEK